MKFFFIMVCSFLLCGCSSKMEGSAQVTQDNGEITTAKVILKDNKIQEGEKIVTSDVSDKFLKGILIGYVSDIKEDPNNLTKTGTLTPAVDFEHLSEVLVIKELKQQKEETE